MATITAGLVKELRDRTGAGMMDCKEALTASAGSLDEAIVYLRKKMGGKIKGREGRSAAEGVIAVVVTDAGRGAIVELNAETDFVARNADFKELAAELARQAAETSADGVESLLALPSLQSPGLTVRERLQDVFTRLRENIVLRRFERLVTDAHGYIAAYVHVPANDRIGVLVELRAASPEEAASDGVRAVGKEIAMQVAAARPQYLKREDVPPGILVQERDIAREQARNEGRPDAALEKIVEGRLRRFYEEAVLLDQLYVRDPKMTVGKLIQETAAGVSLQRFVRFEVGERFAAVAPAQAA